MSHLPSTEVIRLAGLTGMARYGDNDDVAAGGLSDGALALLLAELCRILLWETEGDWVCLRGMAVGIVKEAVERLKPVYTQDGRQVYVFESVASAAAFQAAVEEMHTRLFRYGEQNEWVFTVSERDTFVRLDFFLQNIKEGGGKVQAPIGRVETITVVTEEDEW